MFVRNLRYVSMSYDSLFLKPSLSKVHIKPVKKWGKKCSTGQRFICTEGTSYKIHILALSL